jgi:tRNA nucleotidyltransferase/poly(A) polymerase
MKFTDKQLKHRILKDRYNSIIFEKGRAIGVYLVGGYIRDALIGCRSLDRDYIVDGDLKAFVKEIRDIFGGTIIEFKREGFIRLGFREGLTFDFSKPHGSLTEDLSKRDFTINAIAWSPEEGMIDIYNGAADITRKIIRCISKDNLIADPLRILRAYRFAAQLNGLIDNLTRNYIKSLQNNIITVSLERITLEIFYLLNSDKAARYLKMALYDGVLPLILSKQFKQLEDNIRGIFKLENRILKVLPSNIKVLLNRVFSQNLTYKGLLSLEILLNNDNEHTEDNKIMMSSSIRKRILKSHDGTALLMKQKRLLREAPFNIYMTSQESALDVLITKNRLDLISDLRRFQEIWKNGILSSEEIIRVSGIEKGPELGEIILETKKAQFEKRVRSKKQAIEFIKDRILHKP